MLIVFVGSMSHKRYFINPTDKLGRSENPIFIDVKQYEYECYKSLYRDQTL